MHGSGRDEILGTAYSDHGLVVFLEGASITDPEVRCVGFASVRVWQ